jgi:hypothetical protein
MKGEFSRSTITKRRHYRSVLMQQGRVQQDTDWNEKVDLQVHDELIYLQVWERDVGPVDEDNSINDAAVAGPDGPDTTERSSREEEQKEKPILRLTREVREGCAISMLEVRLGRVEDDSSCLFELPVPEITIDGSRWRRVSSFSGSGPQHRVYVVRENEDDGTGAVEFGDGKNGARPPAGSRVVARYRFGGGKSGNVS